MSGSLPHTISYHSMINSAASGFNEYDQRTDEDNNQVSLNARNARASSDLIITLSEQGQALSYNQQQTQSSPSQDNLNKQTNPNEIPKKDSQKDIGHLNELTPEEEKQVEQLKRRDQEVRLHEQAHSSVGGAQTGTPSYRYQQGPDGKHYITDGEVSINIQKSSGNPEKTIADMEQVYRAALAPAQPSAADRQVATQAQSIINEAKIEQHQSKKTEEPTNSTKNIKSIGQYTLESTKGDFINQIV